MRLGVHQRREYQPRGLRQQQTRKGACTTHPIHDVMLRQSLPLGSAVLNEPEAENKARQCGGSAARRAIFQSNIHPARPGETGPGLAVLCCFPVPVNAALPQGLEKKRISRPKPVSDRRNLGVESPQPNSHPPHEACHRFRAKSRTIISPQLCPFFGAGSHRKMRDWTHADDYDLALVLFAMG